MRIIKTVSEIQSFALSQKISGKKIGVVPTMGYLHDGHCSLISLAAEKCDIIICTLFVNPTQFAPNEDFTAYPRNFEHDCSLAESAGTTVMFAPSIEEMYPDGFATKASISVVSQKFEGAFRPFHFDGVATIVSKLFNCTLPDVAFFGQKDYQQCLVIKRLCKDLNFAIEIVIAPTQREPDGLAMSSRNVYLSPEERKKAVVISKALKKAQEFAELGERNKSNLELTMRSVLHSVPELEIDYAVAANAESLDEPELFGENEQIVFLIAARLGRTRLIDNMLVKAQEIDKISG